MVWDPKGRSSVHGESGARVGNQRNRRCACGGNVRPYRRAWARGNWAPVQDPSVMRQPHKILSRTPVQNTRTRTRHGHGSGHAPDAALGAENGDGDDEPSTADDSENQICARKVTAKSRAGRRVSERAREAGGGGAPTTLRGVAFALQPSPAARAAPTPPPPHRPAADEATSNQAARPPRARQQHEAPLAPPCFGRRAPRDADGTTPTPSRPQIPRHSPARARSPSRGGTREGRQREGRSVI